MASNLPPAQGSLGLQVGGFLAPATAERSPLPSPSTPTIPLNSQVGGHPGVQTTEDGSLLLKTAVPLEVQFYQTVTAQAAFARLRPYVPRFYGTLRLEGQMDLSAGFGGGGLGLTLDASDVKSDEKDMCISLVLENVSHPFLKPNILDIKLGTVLYDEDAPPEKKARMARVAKETTSAETGVRLTGFQVYDNATRDAVTTSKAYGKSLKAGQLPDGIARFFPVAESASPAAAGGGLPRHLLLPVLRRVRDEVANIRDAFAEVELTMVGGSILVIYEGDWERAEETLKAVDFVHAEEEDDDPDEEEDEENGDDDDDESTRLPCEVRLIDFAHTRVRIGKGPDRGVLKGLDTVVKLLDGRIAEVGTTKEP